MTGPARRGLPRSTVALLTAIVGVAVAFVALIASRVGPLEVHAPPYQPPEPPVAQTAQAPPAELTFEWQDELQDPPSGEWLWWVGLALVCLIGVAIVAWLGKELLRALARPAKPTSGVAGAPIGPTVWSHLTVTADVDLGDGRSFRARRAADDIIASWEIVERTAEIVGHPRRAAATPTEFMGEITRVLGDATVERAGTSERAGARRVDVASVRGVCAGSAQEAGHAPGSVAASAVLLRLYHRARFDTEALTPGAATKARRAAHALLSAWDLSHRARVEAEALDVTDGALNVQDQGRQAASGTSRRETDGAHR